MPTPSISATCPFCLSALAADASVCHECGKPRSATISTSSLRSIPSFVRPKSPKVPVRVQLAISVDRTGSSAPFTKGISQLCQSVFTQLGSKVADLKVSVFSHGDLQDSSQDVIQLSSRVTPEQAMMDIPSIQYGGGASADEDHLYAVDQLLQRAGIGGTGIDRGFLLLITTDGTHPHPLGKSVQEIAQEILDRRLVLLLVGTPDLQSGSRPCCPRMNALIEACSGSFFIPISNTPDAAELQAVASMVAASVTRSVNQAMATLPAPLSA
jgi:hypothetical protein